MLMKDKLQVHSPEEKRAFLIRNLIKGFALLAVLIGLFIIGGKTLDPARFAWIQPIFSRVTLVISIFILSESLSGLLPPEIFIIWAMQDGTFLHFMFKVLFLGLISYSAGFLLYTFGRSLRNNQKFRAIKLKFFSKYDKLFREYGGFLIIVAAISPLPFGIIALMGGASTFHRERYLRYSLWRIARFLIYAVILWQIDGLRYV
jgi:membrane protein YqaA with SNARE-associated domain